MSLPRLNLRLSTTCVLTLLVGVVAFSALAPTASAAATYTFYASGSAVGQTSPGVPHDYALNLTNLNSTAAISFNLSVVALPLGWTGQLSQSSLTVGPSGTQQVTLSVTPPATALADSVGKFVNVTATPDDNTTAQTVSTTTRVTETFGVSLTVIAQSGTSGNPGVNVTWLAYLQNTGNSQQTYTVTVDNASYTNTNLTTNLVTVDPGQTRVIQVWINISGTAPVGTLSSYIRAVSTTNSSSQQTVSFTATVNANRAVSLRGLTVDDLIAQTESEASVVYPNIIVSNDGNVGDTYTLQGTANASRHGSWVSFATGTLSLSAFSQQYLSVTVNVPASASATGDYTVEFRIISQNSTSVIAFLNLTVTVTPKHDLAISYDELVGTLSGRPGQTVAFPVNVSNPGAFVQRVDLSYAGPNAGWMQISATPFTLQPGAFRIVYYNFTVPGTQAPTSFNFDVLGAINWSSPSRNRTLTLTLEVSQVYGVIASSTVTQGSGLPGASVVFNIAVRNNGTGTDNFTLQVTNTTQAGLVTLSSTTITGLAAGASQNITVTIDIQSAPAPAAGSYFYTLTSTSSGNVSRTSAVVITLAVEQTYSLSATVTPTYQTADPGDATSYTVEVVNNGNGADTITVQKAGVNQSWLAIPTGSGSIPAGGRMNFTVTATAPTWADVGDTVLSVLAVSGGDANTTASATFTLSLNALYQFALTQAGGNVTDGHRNTTYVVSFVLRNSGNQQDTYTVSLVGADAAWVTLPGNNYTLSPDQNVGIDLVVDTGATPSNGDHSFTLTAISLGASIPSFSSAFTVTINDVFKPEVRILASAYPTTPGTSVTVSYTLRNNGTLVDTVLIEGTAHFATLQQANVTVTRNPGQTYTSSFVFQVTDSPSDFHEFLVEIVATSTVDPAASSTARANITTWVGRTVLMPEPAEAAPGGPGTSSVFNLTLQNDGNITDTYALTATPYGAGWSVVFSVSSVTLAPGESANFTATVTAPTVLPGVTQQYTNAVTARSMNDSSVSRIISLRVSVSFSVTFQLAGSGAELPLGPGQSGAFTVVLNNTGSARDTYTLTASGLAAGWVTIMPAVVNLDALQTTTVTVTVAVPADALEESRTFRVTAAASSGATLSNNELSFTVSVQPVLSFQASGTDTPVSVLPGGSAIFLVTVTNTGNALDTYSLVATLPQYVTFSPGDSITLAALETGNVTVTYGAPLGATAGLQSLRITVYGANGMPADVFLNASVQAIHNITARGLPSGNLSASGSAGAVVDLTVEITNGGNGADIANWTVTGPAAAWTTLASGSVALSAGSSTLVTLPFTIPNGAVAGATNFTVQVVAQGQSMSTAKTVNGLITVGALPGLSFSLDATSDLTFVEVTVDRAAPGTVEYTGYLVNTGNRVEELTVTRQVPQGQGWSVLIDGASSTTITLQPGETREVSIEVSGFPSTAENDTTTISVQSADGKIDRSVSIGVLFARGVAFLDSNSVQASTTHVKQGGAISVSVTVRNIGPGTLTGLTVELRKDGSLVVDSQPLGVVAPGGSASITLTWVTGAADTKTTHSLSVAVLGQDQEVLVPGTMTVDATEESFIQQLTSDPLMPAMLAGGLLVGFVLGFIVRGGRRRRAAREAPGEPVDEQAAALAGLEELEAEGDGALPAEVSAGGDMDGPPATEHKVICPNCAMEQWIVGTEGECPNCGVLIEVDEGSPEGEDDEDSLPDME